MLLESVADALTLLGGVRDELTPARAELEAVVEVVELVELVGDVEAVTNSEPEEKVGVLLALTVDVTY